VLVSYLAQHWSKVGATFVVSNQQQDVLATDLLTMRLQQFDSAPVLYDLEFWIEIFLSHSANTIRGFCTIIVF
jgi:hypothetical protein